MWLREDVEGREEGSSVLLLGGTADLLEAWPCAEVSGSCMPTLGLWPKEQFALD